MDFRPDAPTIKYSLIIPFDPHRSDGSFKDHGEWFTFGDKDEHELWNEYQNRYQVKFTSNHIHFVCKFAKGKGDTLENIARIIGIAPNFIAKPKQGKHSYDDMLAYLIHIKYPKKFQYDPHDVITVVGKEYIEYFREYRSQWMRGRAIRIFADAEIDLKDVKRMIMDGEIGENELLTEERFKYVYQLHMCEIDKLISVHKEYEVKHICTKVPPPGSDSSPGVFSVQAMTFKPCGSASCIKVSGRDVRAVAAYMKRRALRAGGCRSGGLICV